MNKLILTGALAALAFPSFALAAPPPPADAHQSMPMPKKDGCCPEQKDGKKPDDCCKGMKCCGSMKPDASSAAPADAHAGHSPTH
ncbi:MAG: hypothetical protein ABIU10_03305 [Sphingomicrobium sp.]